MNINEKIELIKNHPVMEEVLKDSFWGILYNVANLWKYNSSEILSIYGELSNSEKESLDWITKGAIHFLQEKK